MKTSGKRKLSEHSDADDQHSKRTKLRKVEENLIHELIEVNERIEERRRDLFQILVEKTEVWQHKVDPMIDTLKFYAF
jgi:hypothetical protein